MHEVVWLRTAMGAAALPRQRMKGGVRGAVAGWERRTKARMCALVTILDDLNGTSLEPRSVWRGVALEEAERRIAALQRAQQAEQGVLSPSARRYNRSVGRLLGAYGRRLHALRYHDDALLAAANWQADAYMREAVANQSALARHSVRARSSLR